LVAAQTEEHATVSEADRISINEQLSRLLANPYFSHSKRFPAFLRFVVEQTLAGEADNIKERTLGVEIFGRGADYDTAADPIVRVTAAEIRKRVAQYYQDPAHANEIRISLPSGSYIPKFHWPAAANDRGLKEMDPGVEGVQAGSAQRTAHPLKTRRHSSLVLLLTCIFAGLLSVGGLLLWQAMHRSALDFFWGPILHTPDPVLVCVADQTDYPGMSLRDAADPTHEIFQKRQPKDNLTTVVIDDLGAIANVAGLLQSHGKHYSLKGEGETNLADLRNGPTIFVGAFDNAWTLRLTKPLRFHFSNDAAMTQFGIVDSIAPANPRWVVNRAEQVSVNNYRDYAIVARFTDTNTGKLTVIVAGIARGGTIAAGEFLTDPVNLAELQRIALDGGDKKNMEVVLSTQIIDGEPGSPRLEASYFW